MIPFLILWDVVSKGYKNFNPRLFTEATPSSMDAAAANNEPIPGYTEWYYRNADRWQPSFSLSPWVYDGIYLADNQNNAAKVVSYLTDLPQGMPSIVISEYRLGGETPEASP